MTPRFHFFKKFLCVTFSAASLSIAPVMLGAGPIATAAAVLPDFTDLVDKTGPAVVNIRTTEKQKSAQGVPGPGADDEEMQEFFRRFFGVPVPRSCHRAR